MEHFSHELSTAPGAPDEGLEAAVCTFCTKEGPGGCGKPNFLPAPQALCSWGLTSVCRNHSTLTVYVRPYKGMFRTDRWALWLGPHPPCLSCQKARVRGSSGVLNLQLSSSLLHTHLTKTKTYDLNISVICLFVASKRRAKCYLRKYCSEIDDSLRKSAKNGT